MAERQRGVEDDERTSRSMRADLGAAGVEEWMAATGGAAIHLRHGPRPVRARP